MGSKTTKSNVEIEKESVVGSNIETEVDTSQQEVVEIQAAPVTTNDTSKSITTIESATNEKEQGLKDKTIAPKSPDMTEQNPTTDPSTITGAPTANLILPAPIQPIQVEVPTEAIKNETLIQKELQLREAVVASTEYAESLGNTVQVTLLKLQAREDQVVKLSTSNADLLAKNDELNSQLEFYQKKDSINSMKIEEMHKMEKNIQDLIYITTFRLSKFILQNSVFSDISKSCKVSGK